MAGTSQGTDTEQCKVRELKRRISSDMCLIQFFVVEPDVVHTLQQTGNFYHSELDKDDRPETYYTDDRRVHGADGE